MYKKIKKLSKDRVNYLCSFEEHEWYKGSINYFNGLSDELQEAKNEYKVNNSVYLEDELGDIFWDYLCLLHSLENEGKITSVEKVFSRTWKKFSERIHHKGANMGDWGEIKNRQKQELKKEHDDLYGK